MQGPKFNTQKERRGKGRGEDKEEEGEGEKKKNEGNNLTTEIHPSMVIRYGEGKIQEHSSAVYRIL